MMGEEEAYQLHMQLMHEAIIRLLSRGMERTTSIPQNGYRRRIYFEGMASLGENLSLIASAAASLARASGNDLQPG